MGADIYISSSTQLGEMQSRINFAQRLFFSLGKIMVQADENGIHFRSFARQFGDLAYFFYIYLKAWYAYNSFYEDSYSFIPRITMYREKAWEKETLFFIKSTVM